MRIHLKGPKIMLSIHKWLIKFTSVFLRLKRVAAKLKKSSISTSNTHIEKTKANKKLFTITSQLIPLTT